VSRRRARTAVLETLYQLESRDEEVFSNFEILSICREAMGRHNVFQPDAVKFAETLIQGVWCHKDCLNTTISQTSRRWAIKRIGRIERALMQMALFEIKGMEIPRSVAINEAVELTKEYVSEHAASFVNGILGALVEERDELPQDGASGP